VIRKLISRRDAAVLIGAGAVSPAFADSVFGQAGNSCIQQPPPTGLSPAFFGLTIQNNTTPWPTNIAVYALRDWDVNSCQWGNNEFGDPAGPVETANGVYNWSFFDGYMSQFLAGPGSNHELLFTMGGTNSWAAVGGVGGGLPANMSFMNTFVTTLLAHAPAGLIRYFEVWNEPNGVGVTPSQAVTVASNLWTTVKAIDSTIKIVSPPPTNGGTAPSFLDQYLAAGGSAFTEVIAFHNYSATAEQGLQRFATIQSVAAANGLGTVPIWDTEDSFPTASNPGATVAQNSVYLAKLYLIASGLGIQRVYWHSYDQVSDNTSLVTSTASTALNATGVAWNQVTSWLIGSTIVSPVRRQAGTNQVRNPTFSGGAAPSTIPTNHFMASTPRNGISWSIVSCDATGIVFHFTGTASVSTGFQYRFDNFGVAVLNGQTWTQSQGIQLIVDTAGNFRTAVSYDVQFQVADSGLNFLQSIAQDQSGAGLYLTTAPQTITRWGQVTNASAAFAAPSLDFTIASGSTVDFQVKFSAPTADSGTLWLGTFLQNGSTKEAVWDMVGTPNYTAPGNFTTYTDIAGNVNSIPGSHIIPLQAGPLWLS
jgi:hypothetical protein